MKNFRILAVLFLSVVAVSARSYGEEGFYTIDDNMPAALTQVEKSTVAVWRSGKGGDLNSALTPQATAVLVKIKITKHGKKIGLFLSNAHVMAPCAAVHPCPYKVYYHYIYNSLNRPISLDHYSWDADLKIVGFDPNSDLAAFTVELPSKFKGEPVTLRVWTKNDNPRVYSIGNPYIAARTEWHVKRPNDDQRTLWSTGLAGRIFDKTINGHPVKLVYSSTDILPGNSGGPLVDSNGNVIGINRSILPIPKHAYSKTDMYAQSLGIETVEEFLATVNF